MKGVLFAIALAAGITTAAPVSANWGYQGAYVQAQAQKGRAGRDPERGDRGRDAREERGEVRRDRMTEDERKALHRDLDKANRELYGRRPQK